MTPLTRRARILTALAAVAATAAAVLVVEPGYDTSQVRMRSGAVWLASNQTGHATLVDGATAEVRSRLRVASPGSPLSVAQQGSTAHVLNRATGELRRVDGATEQMSGPVTALPASDGLITTSSPGVLHEIDVHSGTAVSVDPDTLAVRNTPKPLASNVRPDGLGVDDRGRLWVIDHVTGDLVWLADGERRTRSAATRPGSSRLTITRNQPALVDPDRGTAELLDPDTGAVVRSVRPDLRTGDAVVVSGSTDRSRLLIATGTRGALTVCTFDTGSCAAPVAVSSPGGELGTPVEVDDHAVVPDLSTGQATIVDLASSRVVAQRRLFDQPTRFELIARDGIVFFNDPDGNRAGVLDLSGGVQTITKYADEQSEGDSTLPSDRRAQADQVAKVDNGDQKQKQALGTPGQAVRPVRTNPAPPPPSRSPTASIVVKPSNRGVVGDEFELTAVLQPSTGVTTTRWSFGDGTEATGTTVRHRWQQPGTFTVRAATTSGTGVQAPPAETAVIVDPPAAPPTITQLNVRRPKPVIGEAVHFSADTAGDPDGWAWTITRPGRSTPEATARTPEFQHEFAAPGTYTVALTITAGTRTAHFSRQVTVARGTVKAWGRSDRGQTVVPQSALSGVVAVAAGIHHAVALRSDGSVVAWGGNSYGQTLVPAEAKSGVTAIAAGGFHSLALKQDGSVIAWGTSFYNVLKVPLQAKSGVVAIAAGYYHNLALKADGSVIGWGNDEADQTVTPPEAKSGVTAIEAGHYHSLALKADGSVVGWGSNDDGEGSAPPGVTGGVVALAGGVSHSLALLSDGSVIGWGSNYFGQISIPEGARSGVVAVKTSYLHALALKADGTVVGWGRARDGETEVPPEVNGGVLAVAAGEAFSLALV